MWAVNTDSGKIDVLLFRLFPIEKGHILTMFRISRALRNTGFVRPRFLLLLLAVWGIALSACSMGDDPPTPTPVRTNTATPTVAPTDTPTVLPTSTTTPTPRSEEHTSEL